MKLFKKIRKGFTLIELVVVIAVIAILSAVAVVSYISITNKAKKSADEQAVRQMNTALKASSILGAKDITELFDILAEEGMDAKNYKPLSKDTFFFWVQEDNQIVYAKYENGAYIGLYPEAYKGKGKGENHWYSLSKEIKTVDVAKQSNNEYTVGSAEELYTIISEDAYTPSKITLSSDVDLMGADITFQDVTEFDGNNKSLSGLSQLKHQVFESKQQENRNSGLFGRIGKENFPTGTAAADRKLTIKDVVIENSVIGSATTASCGVLAGAVYDGVEVTISNVKIHDCTVYSLQKGGSLIGYVDGASTIKIDSSVEVTGCRVATQYGEAGKLIGAIGSSSKVVNNIPAEKFSVTLESLPNDSKVDVNESTLSEFDTINDVAYKAGSLVYSKSDAGNYGTKKDSNNKTVTDFDNQIKCCFRYFNADAIFTVPAGSTAKYSTTTLDAVTSYVASSVGKTVNVTGLPYNAFTKGCIPVTASML